MPEPVLYQPQTENERWAVDCFEDLAFDFKLGSSEDLPRFHATARRFMRWPILCKIYGIRPANPTSAYDSKLLGTCSVEEAADLFELSVDKLRTDLSFIHRIWQNNRPEPQELPPAPPPPPTPEAKPIPPKRDADTPVDLSIITRCGFSRDIFRGLQRSAEAADIEEQWFARRLTELEKLFTEPMASGLARQALLNELQMRRADEQLAWFEIGSKEFERIHSSKLELEGVYQKQWAQLEEICPFLNLIANRERVLGTLSEIIDGARRYQARADTKLVDALYTSLELQVQMRQSNQAGPRYRPSIVLAVADAKFHLWDPDYTCQIPAKVFKAVDTGWKEAIAKLNAAQTQAQEKVVDLISEGADGEYSPLQAPEEMPAQCVEAS